MSKITDEKLQAAQQQWDAVRQQVDQRLEEYCEVQRLMAAQRSPVEERLWRLLSEVSLAGGKRLRPHLIVLSYKAFGGELNPGIIDVGTGWELLHQGLLIHDDIIDRDYVRHGAPNIAGHLQKFYKHAPNQTERNHYADSGALMAGDIALSSAYQLLLHSGFPAERILQAATILGDTTAAVAGGELLDTEAVMDPIGTTDSIQIAELKTASYTFIGPLKTGALLAGANKVSLQKLAELGTALGIAFQLSDDILGLFGDEHVTGKSVSSDVHEGKRTLLLKYAFEVANAQQKTLIEKTVGNLQATDAQIAEFRNLVIQTGARAKVEALIEDYLQQGDVVMRDLSGVDSSFADSYEFFVAKLRKRKS